MHPTRHPRRAPNRGRRLILILLLLAAPLAPRAGADDTTQTAKAEDRIVAIVNDAAITRFMVVQRARLNGRYRDALQGRGSPQMPAQQVIMQIEQQTLASLAEELLIEQYAVKQKIGLDKQDEKDLEKSLELRAEPFGGMTGFENQLAKIGVELETVRAQERANILQGKVFFEEITRRLFVTPKQLRAFYSDKETVYLRDARTQVRRITLTLDPDNTTPAIDKWLKENKLSWGPKACRKLGETLIAWIGEGREVGRLAREYSMRFTEREKDGLWVFESRTETYAKIEGVRGLAEACKGLKEGGVSGLVERKRGGYTINYLEMRRPRRKESFSTAQYDAVNRIKNDEWSRQVRDWITRLKKKATIVFFQLDKQP